MSCAEFEGLLDALLDGRLAVADHARCAAHVASCVSCSELVLPMGNDLRPVSAPPPASLRRAVLRRTTLATRRSRWAATCRTWVLRPRFASEVAYVGVVMLTLACAAVDQSTLAHYRTEAGILLDRATSLLEKERP